MTRRLSRWTLRELADLLDAELIGRGDSSPTRVSSDTRTIEPGALFVALSGERFDGHDFVAQAAERDACAALVSRRVDVDLDLVVVDDPLAALQRLGRAVFDALTLDGARSVALTGSNGKTTTKELIAALLRTQATVHATTGNLNNHIGVPLTLCDAPDEVDVLVLEMGANGFGDIEELVEIAPTQTRVVTSIGAAHLEGFGSLDGVRRAKSEIFSNPVPRGVAVVPIGEVDRLDLGAFPGERILTAGPHDSGADVQYEQTALGRVTIRGSTFEYDLTFSIPGAHNAQNLATAFATTVGAGGLPSPAEAQEALDDLHLPGGRWREVSRGDWRVLDDAYNANPSSVRASWDAFAEIVERDHEVDRTDVVAVLGEMLELGEHAEHLHAETAAWVAERGGAGALVFVGAFADAMADAARKQSGRDVDVEAFELPSHAGAWLATRPPGLVWLKASRGQKLERIIEELPG